MYYKGRKAEYFPLRKGGTVGGVDGQLTKIQKMRLAFSRTQTIHEL